MSMQSEHRDDGVASPAGTARPDKARRKGRLRWVILGVATAMLLLNYADRAAIGVAGPAMIEDLGLTNAQFGLITSIFFLGYAPFCLIGGQLADRFGPRKVMAAAITVWSTFVGLTAVGTGFVSLLFIRILFGVGEGPQGAVTTKLVANWFPQREMGRAVATVQSGTPLGGAIGTPLVAALIAGTGDWRVPFVVLGLVGVLAAVGWWAVVRDAPSLHPRAVTDDVDVLDQGRVDAATTGTGTGTTTDAGTDCAGSGPVPPLSQLLRRPLVLAVAVAFFAYSWVLYTFLSWFPVYLSQEQGVEMSEIALAATVPWIFGVAGFLCGGVVTDRLAVRLGVAHRARAMVIICGLLTSAVLLAGIGLVSNVTAAVALMSGIVFALYVAGGQYFVIITDTVPRARVGSVSGFVHLIANLAGVVAPVLVGLLVDRTGSWALTFGLSAVIAVAGAVVVAIWGLRHRTVST